MQKGVLYGGMGCICFNYFSSCRFYTNLHETFPELGRLIVNDVEKEINFLVRVEGEIQKRNQ